MPSLYTNGFATVPASASQVQVQPASLRYLDLLARDLRTALSRPVLALTALMERVIREEVSYAHSVLGVGIFETLRTISNALSKLTMENFI